MKLLDRDLLCFFARVAVCPAFLLVRIFTRLPLPAMDLVAATKAYISRMIAQTPGVKVLLLDSETVKVKNNDAGQID
jgi:hypothetical protein